MSPRPRREDRYPDLKTAIKETAWNQIAEFGAPSISLRSIARELKITAPSIYSYYPSRDDLFIMLEIGNQFPSFIVDPVELFQCEINNFLKQYL